MDIQEFEPNDMVQILDDKEKAMKLQRDFGILWLEEMNDVRNNSLELSVCDSELLVSCLFLDNQSHWNSYRHGWQWKCCSESESKIVSI